jgi:poly-gamma-glutamate synthesis protein (capsule biosynthesis protein)
VPIDVEIPPATVVTPTYQSSPVTLAWQTFPGDAALESGDRPVTLICVGDLMFGRRVGEAIRDREERNPFEGVSDILRSGDFAVGNLECVLGDAVSFKQWSSWDKILLPAPRIAAKYLYEAGFRLVSLGNNHSLDFKEEGFYSTVEALQTAGVTYVGTWEDASKLLLPTLLEVRGVRIAFLAFSDVSPPVFRAGGVGHPGTIPPMPGILKQAITRAKGMSDLVVVFAHFGKEYELKPNERQMTLARLMVDAGADAVVGHHTHVLQATERYKGKFIVYGLGNFLFDLKRPITHPSLALRLRLEKGRAPIADFLPVWAGDGFPRPPKNEELPHFPRWLFP